MKTLLIITSIILLSFQIDRLLVGHLSGSSDNIEILSHFASGAERTPAKTNKTSGSGLGLAAPEKAVAANLVKTTEIAVKTTGVKLRSNNHNTTAKNSLLHQSVKASGNYLEMATLRFEVNKYRKKDTRSFNVILQLADRLIFNDSLKISIAGFTDNTGDASYNTTLSLQRASHIKQYLLDLGVNDKQIIVSANGIAYPVADNATTGGRAANRRVEMMLIR